MPQPDTMVRDIDQTLCAPGPYTRAFRHVDNLFDLVDQRMTIRMRLRSTDEACGDSDQDEHRREKLRKLEDKIVDVLDTITEDRGVCSAINRTYFDAHHLDEILRSWLASDQCTIVVQCLKDYNGAVYRESYHLDPNPFDDDVDTTEVNPCHPLLMIRERLDSLADHHEGPDSAAASQDVEGVSGAHPDGEETSESSHGDTARAELIDRANHDDGDSPQDEPQAPALTKVERMTLAALATFDPSHLASAADVSEAMPPGENLSDKTARLAIKKLVKLDLAERPEGRNQGARLTMKGRRLATKIAD